jgi:hypothetical protein
VSSNPVLFTDPSGRFAQLADTEEDDCPCSERTYWDASMCEEDPPCACGGTKSGKAPISPTFPINDLWAKKIASDLGVKCTVVVKVANCGPLKGISWTCSRGLMKQKRKIYICIDASYSSCDAYALLWHELVHARQFCDEPNHQKGQIPPGECVKYETEAYKVSCELESKQHCCNAIKGKAKCADDIDQCVTNGVNEISCNPANRATFDPCTTANLRTIFPNEGIHND